MSHVQAARLRQLAGPGVGSVFGLKADATIGRSNTCDITVADGAVSRKHARVERSANGFHLEDLGSGNGTLLNGEEVVRRRLANGDEITVGSAVFAFEEDEATDRRDVTLIGGKNLDTRILAEISLRGGVPEPQGDTALKILSTRLRTVTALSEAASNLLDVDDLLTELNRSLLELYPIADRALVFEVDAEGEASLRGALRRHSERDGPLEVSHTILRTAIDQQTALLSRNAMDDERFRQGRSIVALEVRSVMAAPMIFRGEVLGVVHVDSPGIEAFDRSDLELLSGIAAQCAIAVGSAKLHEQGLREQRLAQDLQMAERIQLSFLPERVPTVPGFEFAAHYEPAYRIGGDFYDFMPLPHGKLGLAVGDVSGKGVSAALYMARLGRDLRYLALAEPDPASILAGLNRSVVEGARDDVLVTLILAILDPKNLRLVVANAGHMPLLIRRADGRVGALEGGAGLPLGVLADEQYETRKLSLGDGDTILLYSDGLVEAMNSAGEMFGNDRLTETMGTAAQTSAEATLQTITEACRQFVGDAAPFDDTTAICIAVR